MIYVIVAILIFVIELCIKNYIEKNKQLNEEVPLIENELSIKYIRNKGAVYSTFEDKSDIVCGVSIGVFIMTLIAFIYVILKKQGSWLKLGMSFIVAGGASNVYDRIKRKYVVDYIYWKKLKKIIFNLADIFIVIGTFIVMIFDLLNDK